MARFFAPGAAEANGLAARFFRYADSVLTFTLMQQKK